MTTETKTAETVEFEAVTATSIAKDVNKLVNEHLATYREATKGDRQNRPTEGFDRLTLEFPLRREGKPTIMALRDRLLLKFGDKLGYFNGSIVSMLTEASKQGGGFFVTPYDYTVQTGTRTGETVTRHYVQAVMTPTDYSKDELDPRFQ